MKKNSVIFAMKEETEAFLNLIDIDKEYDVFDLHFIECIINDINLILVTCGIGKVNAARCT